jgi:hypothetical protein
VNVLGRAVIVATACVLLGCTTSTTPQPNPSATPVDANASDGPSAAAVTDQSPVAVAIAPVTACDLLFKAEASAALGITIGTAQSTSSESDDEGWDNDCLYRRQSFCDLAPLQLEIASGQRYFDAFESLKLGEDVTPVTGVGDEALARLSTIWGLPGQVAALYVKSGGAVMDLSLGVADLAPDGSPLLVGDAGKQQQALLDLAAIVVGRRYNGADGNVELLVAVNSQPAAVPHYDECKANFETIIGVGQEALYSVSCPIQVEFQSINNPLLVRSGATVVAVGEGGQMETEQARALEVDVARLVLQRLGLDPGSTPGPVASSVLVHPCALVSNAEVAAAVGVEIVNQSESSAGENVNAMCTYRTADENEPLRMDVGTGQYALQAFANLRNNPSYPAVEGVGDEAYSTQYAVESDQPLVSLSVRKGETVLDLSLGGNSYSADGKLVAPGTPAEQLTLLRGLAELILPRVFAGG